jgi:hypothetical protein
LKIVENEVFTSKIHQNCFSTINFHLRLWPDGSGLVWQPMGTGFNPWCGQKKDKSERCRSIEVNVNFWELVEVGIIGVF